jgi:hypothetical protein
MALLISGVASRQNSAPFVLASTNLMLELSSTGPASAALAHSFGHSELNNVPSQRLEWALSNNSRLVAPQMFPISDTNYLIH